MTETPLAPPRPRLSEAARLTVLLAMTAVILGLVNLLVVQKERIVREGTVVLLRLAPADPRSLLQGDYMALRYAIADEVGVAARAAEVSDGIAIIELDPRGEARFVAIDRGDPLGDGQHRLRFRKRGDAVRLASDAFFFEEGDAELYEFARFGELRVAPDGEAVLTGLRDDSGDRLPASPEPR